MIDESGLDNSQMRSEDIIASFDAINTRLATVQNSETRQDRVRFRQEVDRINKDFVALYNRFRGSSAYNTSGIRADIEDRMFTTAFDICIEFARLAD